MIRKRQFLFAGVIASALVLAIPSAASAGTSYPVPSRTCGSAGALYYHTSGNTPYSHPVEYLQVNLNTGAQASWLYYGGYRYLSAHYTRGGGNIHAINNQPVLSPSSSCDS